MWRHNTHRETYTDVEAQPLFYIINNNMNKIIKGEKKCKSFIKSVQCYKTKIYLNKDLCKKRKKKREDIRKMCTLFID